MNITPHSSPPTTLRFARTIAGKLVVGSARQLASGEWLPWAIVTPLDIGDQHAAETELPMPQSTLSFKTEFEAADYAVKTAVNIVAAFRDVRSVPRSRS